MFDIELTPTIIILYALAIISSVYLLFGFRHYISSVRNKVIKDNDAPFPTESSAYPSISVIVYSEDDAENLEILLPQILEQDYEGRFEVIVVNDGAVSSTKDVIARLEPKYPNLYMTFTPLDSRSLSRKKLAITLGIKAARYEIVLLTTGDCRIESKTWMKCMARHFVSGKEIVVGYATPLIPDDAANPWKRLHSFDSVRTAIEYMSWAIAGRPYRGNCHNLAYRRSVFFKNKGFSRSLHLKYGDDDVFVNEVATSSNTAVELSTASIVEVYDNYPQQSHRNTKLRYDYTAKSVHTMSRLFFGSCSLAWWLMTAAVVALAIIGWPSIIPLAVGCILWIATALTIMFAWRNTSVALDSRRLLLTVPWFMTIEPIYNLYYRLKGFLKRGQNLSWN